MKRRRPLVWWCALRRVYLYQPLVANELLKIYGNPADIFNDCPLDEIRNFDDWDGCEEDVASSLKLGCEIIALDDERYPDLLREIPARPVVITAKGDTSSLAGPCVSIVGARKAGSHGRQIAFEIARDLSREGIVVVSGMAYGIDAAAHMGALECGRTVAVWGCGIDVCYPPQFHDLSLRIAKAGCIVSEFPFRTSPMPHHFPQRNRIISGLSTGTVVVEAAARSGSLITARFAIEQNRDVFSVPGIAGGLMSQGTHELLRRGAIFVENAGDILNAILSQISGPEKNPRHLALNDNNGAPK